jgi:hypothetical protein
MDSLQFAAILFFSLITVTAIGYDNPTLPKLNPASVTAGAVVNYSLIPSVNSSKFWGIYDYLNYNLDPILSFAYNQTLGGNNLYLNLSGTNANQNINIGANNLTATRFTSTQPTGTSPLAVTSTTKVTNLNCDYLNGYSTGTSGAKLCPLNSAMCTFSGIVAPIDGVLTSLIGDASSISSINFNDATGEISIIATALYIGIAPTNDIGFYGATPISQQAQTTDLKDMLVALGLMSAVGGATPLNLDGGAITSGGITSNAGGLVIGSNTLGSISFTASDGTQRVSIHMANFSKNITSLGNGGDDLLISHRQPNSRTGIASTNATGGQVGTAINLICGGGSNAGYCNFTSNTKYVYVTENLTVGGNTILKTANISGNVIIAQNLSVKRAFYYGYDNSTQTNPSIANANILNISNNADVLKYGMRVTNSQNLTFDSTGIYICDVSPEFLQNGGSSQEIGFWMQKNGTDIPWSNSRYTLSNNQYYAPTIPFAFEIRNPTTEYVRFMWYSDSTNTIIYSSGALTSPTRPSVPGVIINCRKSSEIIS